VTEITNDLAHHTNREVVHDYIVLDWYDGPLLQAAKVDFKANQWHPDRSMVQVESLCTVEGEYPWQRATYRLSREDLLKMLDILDGKPVKDFHDEE
jgi:hypothetical protein